MGLPQMSFFVFISALYLLLQGAVESRSVPREEISRGLTSYNYRSYMSFNQMEKRINDLKRSFPNQLKVEIAGKSVEGRNIYLVIINRDIHRALDEDPVSAEQGGNLYDSGGSRFDHNKAISFPRFPRRDILDQKYPEHVKESVNLGDDTRDDGDDDGDDDDKENQPRGFHHGGKKPANRLPIGGKPVIFVDGGIHAREWVAPAAAFYLIDQLLKTPHLITDLEWRIIPMVNPDGYAYSHESSAKRMWRKNRAKTRNRNCPGVDLNRNFDVYWQNTNRQNPCAETFSGTGPFSEPESRAIRDALQKVQSRLEAYITLHTYGQLILYPYGYTKNRKPSNVAKLISMGDGMADAIYKKYRNTYRVRQASVLGAAAGGSDDWAYMKMGAPYSYTFELQDKVGTNLDYSSKGFQLPAYRLPQAVDECWIALKYLGERIMREKGWGTSIVAVREEEEEEETESAPSPPLTKTAYPVGWTQVMNEVRRVQAEARVKSEGKTKTDCIREGNMFVCPHMVFWGSMYTNFKRN